MAVYYIIYQNVTDPDQFMEYVQAVMPAIAQRGGRMIAEGTPETVEGALSWQRAVVFEWPSRQHLLNFLHSDKYVAIRKLREGAVQWQSAIVEGVSSSN